MVGVRLLLIICVMPTVLLLFATQLMMAASQPTDQLQPRFNRALEMVHRAETAGATRQEVADLVVLLNRALELNEEAVKLTGPDDDERRGALLAQVEATLASVEENASRVEFVASQRTSAGKVTAHVAAGIAAFAATLAYVYGTSFWRTYRIKRTFQMRISPK